MTCARCNNDQDRFPLYDARGIFVTYVCDVCEKSVKQRYRLEVFSDADYDCDESVEAS